MSQKQPPKRPLRDTTPVPENARLTLRELLAQLAQLVANDPKVLDLPVATEGCDCTGDCVGVAVDACSVEFLRYKRMQPWAKNILLRGM